MNLPSFWKSMLVSIVFGLGQGWLMIETTKFVFMPITFGSLPFDIAAFALGCTARRNRWLREDLPQFFEKRRCMLNILTVLSAVICWGVSVMQYVGADKPGEVGQTPAPTTTPSPTKEDNPVGEIGFLIAGSTITGPITAILCLTALEIFQSYFDYTSPVTKFFANAAYAAYLIHPWIVVPLTYCFQLILEGPLDSVVYFAEGEGSYSKTVLKDGYLWMGWFFVAFLSQLITWPLASGLRRLPLFREVL